MSLFFPKDEAPGQLLPDPGPQGPPGPTGPQGPAGTGLTTLTTKGDLLYQGDTAGERLPIGSTGQILKVALGGIPEWGAAPESGVTSVAGKTGAVTLISSDVANVVSSITTGITGASTIGNMVAISQANYSAITSPNATTLYLITDP